MSEPKIRFEPEVGLFFILGKFFTSLTCIRSYALMHLNELIL